MQPAHEQSAGRIAHAWSDGACSPGDAEPAPRLYVLEPALSRERGGAFRHWEAAKRGVGRSHRWIPVDHPGVAVALAAAAVGR